MSEFMCKSKHVTYDFEAVERFLRTWPWIDGEPNQYDLCGCLYLLSAITANLSRNAEDDELSEFLSENRDFFAEEQLGLMRKILAAAEQVTSSPS